MKKSHSLLKLLALATSMLLAGGYVSFRAGAFDRVMNPGVNAAPAVTQEVPAEGEQTNSTSIPDPKSGDSQAKDEKTTRVFFSGSKSPKLTMFNGQSASTKVPPQVDPPSQQPETRPNIQEKQP